MQVQMFLLLAKDKKTGKNIILTIFRQIRIPNFHFDEHLILCAKNTKIFHNHSHNIRKLNPKNRPRTPPQSATRELKGKATSSLLTRILSPANSGHTCIPSPAIGILSGFLDSLKKLQAINNISNCQLYDTLYSI